VHHIERADVVRGATYGLLLLDLGGLLGASLLLRLALLEKGLGNEDIVLGRDGTKKSPD